MTGERWRANLTLASTDRVALDAVGVAALRSHGTTKKVEEGAIFELDQIRRAVELGLGASGPEEIDLLPVNDESKGVVERILEKLRA